MFNLLDKLAKLRDYIQGNRGDQTDVILVEAWISEAKKLFLLKSLKDHDGIKYVLEIFQKEIEGINDKLLNKRQMLEDERYRLLDQRELAKKYLDLFLPIDGKLEEIEKKVDSENY